MEHAGAIIGNAFSLEGFAFFTEAFFWASIFTVGKRVHRSFTGFRVVVALSGIFLGHLRRYGECVDELAAGFKMVDGKIADIDLHRGDVEPRLFSRSRAYDFGGIVATGFMVAAIHAFFLLA